MKIFTIIFVLFFSFVACSKSDQAGVDKSKEKKKEKVEVKNISKIDSTTDSETSLKKELKSINLDYEIKDNQFVTSEGVVPPGCLAQLLTELNGDNTIAAIFLNRAFLRGCVSANEPYPGGDENDVSYEIISDEDDNTFKLRVCQFISEGSLGADCSKILVQFVNKTYILPDEKKEVLALEKIGEW